MLYLLAVVVAAARFRQGPAVAAALLGIASFDFFFVHPYYTFSVSDVRYVLTFGVMLIVALVMGNLTGRIRNAGRSGARAGASHRRALCPEPGPGQRPQATSCWPPLRSVRDTFAVEAAVFLPEPEGRIQAAGRRPIRSTTGSAASHSGPTTTASRRATAPARCPRPVAFYVPLTASGRVVGVLGIQAAVPDSSANPPGAGCSRRSRRRRLPRWSAWPLAERSRQTAVEFEAERLRTALLSSLSHDMRTPLASIEQAAATMLLRTGAQGDATDQGKLAGHDPSGIAADEPAGANLLDMIRVGERILEVQKEWQLLSDVVGVALLRMEEQLRDHPVTNSLPPACRWFRWTRSCWSRCSSIFWRMRPSTLRPGRRSRSGAEARGDEILVWVADRGPGTSPGRGGTNLREVPPRRAAPGTGVGLGLAICRGIVNAHGGRIWAENRTGGGAVFRFTIPIVGTPPTIPVEEAEFRPRRRKRSASGSSLPLVLLVEDEPQMRRFLRAALTPMTIA